MSIEAVSGKLWHQSLFVTDAGLTAGAFRQWIYAPYQRGAFIKGAPGRVESTAKAAVAGQFVLSRLQEVKVNTQANPALCKRTIGAIDKPTSTMRAMVAAAKTGGISSSQVTSATAYLGRIQAASAEAGAPFRAQSVSSLPFSD